MRLTTVEPPALQSGVALRELSAAVGWEARLAGLRGLPGFWLLESTLASPHLGRWSFAGSLPYAVLRVHGDRNVLDVKREARPDLQPGRTLRRGDPFAELRALLPPRLAALLPDAPPFVGGAVGWLGYELAEWIERLELHGADDLGAPDALWLLVDRVLAHELASGRCVAAALGFAARAAEARDLAERAVDAWIRELDVEAPGAGDERERDVRSTRVRRRGGRMASPCGKTTARGASSTRRPSPAPVRGRDPETGLVLHGYFDESSYGKAVEAIRQRIAAGDVYQANLTHRIDVELDSPAWSVYRALRTANPAPFAAFLELPELAVVGSSPERFLRLDPERRVEARPMKGTRPRGPSADADAALERELAASAKDRAENLMIVDLMRNDLGRVCEVGSIEVPELMAIERYATVFQLISSVTGRLRAGCDVVDLLRATFPPGSMTGAPKIAAMQLLARLEPVRRGVYSGTLGYVDVRGGAELCVVIRTLLRHAHGYSLHVGGAVVADSDPFGEWSESLDKARALLDALARQAEAAGPGVR